MLRFDECITGEAAVGPAGTGACRAISTATANGANSGLYLSKAVAVAAGSRDIYVGGNGDSSIARFTFNKANGNLSYRGCLTTDPGVGPAGSGACDALPTLAPAATGFDGPEEMTVSRDGRDVYVTIENDSSIARFRRADNGVLTWAGCISGDTNTGPAGSGACSLVPLAAAPADNSGLEEPFGIDLSPDQRFLYVAHDDDGVAWLRRDPASGP